MKEELLNYVCAADKALSQIVVSGDSVLLLADARRVLNQAHIVIRNMKEIETNKDVGKIEQTSQCKSSQ